MAKPEIRLNSFKEDWETSTIGSMTSSFSGGTPLAGHNDYYGGHIPFIRSGEIHDDKTALFITELGLKSSSAKLVNKGTILYALYGATSGEVDISRINGAINQAILAIIPQDSINRYFLCDLLQSKKNNIVSTLLQGGQGNLSGNLIKRYGFSYPSLNEQEEIAKYFRSLDALIQAAAKKIDSLKQMKAACLQSMFPQPGETAPKVRFKGFTGDWEDVSFKDITFLAGVRNKENLSLESYSISNEKGFVPQNEQFEKGGTMTSADKTLYYIVSADTFAYNPARINVGSIGYYEFGPDIIVSSLYVVFKTDENTYNPFLNYWFKTPVFRKLVNFFQEGGVRFYFFYDKLCSCRMRRPSLEEQQQIASFFSELDSQIRLHEQKLAKLKQIKASCLDKMFV